MWTSTQKIGPHWHNVFSCKEVGVFCTRISSLNGINSGNFSSLQISNNYKLLMVALNKLRSCYIRTSALGPKGYCNSCFQRVMCVLCRRQVDVHKGTVGGQSHVDALY